MMNAPRRMLVCLLALAASACGDDEGTGPDTPPAPNFVRLRSDAGDWVGGGASYDYDASNADILVTAGDGRLSVLVDGDQNWVGAFQTPSGSTRLRRGSYTGLQRYDLAMGWLEWSGEGRGCDTLRGSFTVDSVTYVGDSLTTVDLRFEQHCEGSAPALRGTIHWRADDKTAVPGPITPIPTGLWQPAAGATPATGDYAYLQSDDGDYIGGGVTRLYTEPDFTLDVTSTGNQARLWIRGAEWWVGNFQAMNALSRLQPGYYRDLVLYPYHNPRKGGLSWVGEGRWCNELTGWFAVDRVTYSGDALTALELRFEQHCDRSTSALHGKIRWSA